MPVTVAFIGLGNMGGPMVANLVKAGHRILGYDLSAASCQAASESGATIAGSVGEAVGEAEVAITMLPAGKHVLSVWAEAVPAARPGTLFIDCSTIDLGSARAAHALAAGHEG